MPTVSTARSGGGDAEVEDGAASCLEAGGSGGGVRGCKGGGVLCGVNEGSGGGLAADSSRVAVAGASAASWTGLLEGANGGRLMVGRGTSTSCVASWGDERGGSAGRVSIGCDGASFASESCASETEGTMTSAPQAGQRVLVPALSERARSLCPAGQANLIREVDTQNPPSC